jgi:hypothetical protein
MWRNNTKEDMQLFLLCFWLSNEIPLCRSVTDRGYIKREGKTRGRGGGKDGDWGGGGYRLKAKHKYMHTYVYTHIKGAELHFLQVFSLFH